jgi:hypothetical protein
VVAARGFSAGSSQAAGSALLERPPQSLVVSKAPSAQRPLGQAPSVEQLLLVLASTAAWALNVAPHCWRRMLASRRAGSIIRPSTQGRPCITSQPTRTHNFNEAASPQVLWSGCFYVRRHMPVCPACPARVEPNATHCSECGASFFQPDLGILESRLTPEQEARAQVPGFVPVTLGLVGIAGAAWGLMGLSIVLAKGWPGVLNMLFAAVAASLFIFGAYAGVLALRRAHGWLRTTTVFWALQIPVLSSPVVSYSLASGGFVSVWLQLYPSLLLGNNFSLGSTWMVSVFGKAPFVVGANLVAVAKVLYLTRVQSESAT